MRKLYWKNYYGMKVFRVDGMYVRNNLYIDFVAGGNPARYNFVPRDEIWIEGNLNAFESEATLLHEFVEYQLMLNKKMKYNQAHAIACKQELAFRNKYTKIIQVANPTNGD